MRRIRISPGFCGVVLLGALCSTVACQSRESPMAEKKTGVAVLQLTSSAFAHGAAIPAKYACDSENVSPPMAWRKFSEKTKSFALVCDDPDAPGGNFVHWVIYNMPATLNGLRENIPSDETLPPAIRQGRNDFHRMGYSGPCPPRGNPHRYFFRLFALDVELALNPGASENQLMNAMKGHILAEGQLMGTYQRR